MKIWTLHNEVLEPIEEAVNNHYDTLDSEVLEDIETALEKADTTYKYIIEKEVEEYKETIEDSEEEVSNLQGLLETVQESLDQLVNHISTDTNETQEELKSIIKMIYKGV